MEAILDLSALEAGRFPLRLQALDLGRMADEAAGRFQPLPQGRRIVVSQARSAPPVLADERALASVFYHLIDNGLKYAPSGDIRLEAEADAQVVRLSVRDFGEGIPPEEREKVFDMFHRLDSSDSRQVYGHGLGLHLVRRILEAMSGGIRVESAEGGGSQFTFWLPARRRAGEDDAYRAQRATAGGGNVSPRLLVIDDDPTLVRFLREYFEREGYQVSTSGSGQQGLRQFYAERPDLVVVDVMMPGMDGWEVTARLRELAETPVIMLTAKTGESDKLRGFRLGVDDYVTKPFSLAELGARVGAVLARAAARAPSEETLYVAGPISVDMKKRQASLDASLLDLTPTEFRLLACLAQRAGEAVSQDELSNAVWGQQRAGAGSALRRYVWFLRKKIEPDPEKPQRLSTVRGFGYRLEA